MEEFKGKIVVVKFGGDLVKDRSHLDDLCHDVHFIFKRAGIIPVLVHGYGPQLDAIQKKMGIKPKKVDGLRNTDLETIAGVYGASAAANHDIVSAIYRTGSEAVGMSGANAGIFFTRKYLHHKRTQEIDLGYVGVPEEVNIEVIQAEIKKGRIPVISSLGMDRNDDYNVYNINADVAASHLARALKAVKIIYMTNTNGILKDKEDENSTISYASPADVEKLIHNKTVDKGMLPKVNGCLHALEGGVPRAHIINGYTPNAVPKELLTTQGSGTMIASAAEIAQYQQELS